MDTIDKAKRAILKKSNFFKEFDDKILDALTPFLHDVRFDAESLICLKGDESDCLYIVKEGQAEVSISSKDGKVIILGMLSEGDVFGEIGLVDQESRTANVAATSAVTLYKLNNADFNKVTVLFGVKEWMALATYICALFRRAANNLEETVFLDASVRIARKILDLHARSHEDRNEFRVTISQENLGRMAGLSREATNKALSVLADQGLIVREYKRIAVPDIKKLAAAVARESA